MSYQNSNRKPKIVRPRIDEEAYLTLCSWVGKSNSAKIMVADKMLKAQRDKITQLEHYAEIKRDLLDISIKQVDSLIGESTTNYHSFDRMRESKNSWKSSFLILLSINIASFVFWMVLL